MLVADANGDGGGAIVALAAGTAPHVANAGALVAIAGSGVGRVSDAGTTAETAPLRHGGATGNLTLAGNGGSGDFRIANDGSRPVAAIPLEVANAESRRM